MCLKGPTKLKVDEAWRGEAWRDRLWGKTHMRHNVLELDKYCNQQALRR